MQLEDSLDRLVNTATGDTLITRTRVSNATRRGYHLPLLKRRAQAVAGLSSNRVQTELNGTTKSNNRCLT